MSRRDVATRQKREPTIASLVGDAVAVAQNAALAPVRLTWSWTKWLGRVATPPLIPLAVLAAMIPILLFMSLLTGFYVWKSGAVGWLATLDLQYGDGVPPYAQTPLPAMSSIEPYDVILHLTLPANTANYELGNFMTALTLTTTKNRTVTGVRKPAIVLPPTQYLPFSTRKKVQLDVPLLHDYVAGTTNLVATIVLGRNDGWKSIGSGVGREVSVLSASLEGVLKYRGIRGIVSKYPISSATIAAAMFFVTSFATVALLLAPAILWQYQGHEDIVKTEAPGPSPIDEKPRRRSSLKRSTSRGADEQIKHEAEDVTMPSSSSPATPLRRRRSRISE